MMNRMKAVPTFISSPSRSLLLGTGLGTGALVGN